MPEKALGGSAIFVFQVLYPWDSDELLDDAQPGDRLTVFQEDQLNFVQVGKLAPSLLHSSATVQSFQALNEDLLQERQCCIFYGVRKDDGSMEYRGVLRNNRQTRLWRRTGCCHRDLVELAGSLQQAIADLDRYMLTDEDRSSYDHYSQGLERVVEAIDSLAELRGGMARLIRDRHQRLKKLNKR